MTIFEKLIAARNAVNYGEQLANSATWKQRTTRINALFGLVAAALPFAGIDADAETMRDFAGGIGAVWVLYNNYIHAATSTKIGLQSNV
jgi:hypothetical protein